MTKLQSETDIAPLRAYVTETLLAGQQIADDDELLISGRLDSLAVMSLVSFVEDTYALSVPFSDVLIENFESLDAMARYLTGRMSDA